MDWKVDEGESRRVAQRTPRDRGAAPHWLRCEAVRQIFWLNPDEPCGAPGCVAGKICHANVGAVLERCILGDGHGGEHVAPKAA